jgi:hypothetical protein
MKRGSPRSIRGDPLRSPGQAPARNLDEGVRLIPLRTRGVLPRLQHRFAIHERVPDGRQGSALPLHGWDLPQRVPDRRRRRSLSRSRTETGTSGRCIGWRHRASDASRPRSTSCGGSATQLTPTASSCRRRLDRPRAGRSSRVVQVATENRRFAATFEWSVQARTGDLRLANTRTQREVRSG